MLETQTRAFHSFKLEALQTWKIPAKYLLKVGAPTSYI
jgi:hypothetical protein